MNEAIRDHQEVEWQFDALDVRPVSKWLQGDWQGRDPSVVSGETRELTDDCFDTEGWSIYRAGYALRIRHEGEEKRAEATLKRLASKNGKAGFRKRREISEPLDSGDPELLIDAPDPVGDRVRALIGPKALRPLFEVKTCRSTQEGRGQAMEEASERDGESPPSAAIAYCCWPETRLPATHVPVTTPLPAPKTSAEGRSSASTSASEGWERSSSMRSAGSPDFKLILTQPARSR